MLWYSIVQNKSHIKSNYLKEDVLNLLDKTFVIPDSYTYNIFEVGKEYIARPDLIALDAYGDTMYTDVMCKLNGISNPFELNEGMKLILPAPEDIDKFIIKPPIEESEDYVDPTSTQSTKTKTSKRQANEAIIGDSRFKIDKNSKIVIY
jgi:hypothetical protein